MVFSNLRLNTTDAPRRGGTSTVASSPRTAPSCALGHGEGGFSVGGKCEVQPKLWLGPMWNLQGKHAETTLSLSLSVSFSHYLFYMPLLWSPQLSSHQIPLKEKGRPLLLLFF